MIRLFSILCLLIFCSSTPILAQEIASSFRVGLNFSRITGPSQSDASGNSLEQNRNTTGFHVAGGAVFKFLENYGMKAELVFSQKGYEYDGMASRVFRTTLSGNPLVTTGDQQITVRVTNSYLEIPVTGYAKLGKKLEFQGGASISFLVSSKGVGDWNYSGTSSRDNDAFDISINLDHNYSRDEVFTTPLPDLDPENTTEFIADGETIRIPNQIGAYFDYDTKDGNFYNPIDVGLHAGISYFLSPGLFVNFTGQFGLLDITNNNYDFSQTELNDTATVPRSDTDRNFSLQGSIGFSF